MENRKYAYSVLIVSSSDKNCTVLSGMLCRNFQKPCLCVHSGNEARQKMMERRFDVIIINAPLADESGTDLALNAAENGNSAILIVKNEIYDEICHKTEHAGVFVMAKPFSAQFFLQVQKLVLATCEKIRIIEKDCLRLKSKVDELKIVSYAKCLMIEFMGCTEQEAHRHIEKQAMDLRVTRREVAESIIKKYEC